MRLNKQYFALALSCANNNIQHFFCTFWFFDFFLLDYAVFLKSFYNSEPHFKKTNNNSPLRRSLNVFTDPFFSFPMIFYNFFVHFFFLLYTLFTNIRYYVYTLNLVVSHLLWTSVLLQCIGLLSFGGWPWKRHVQKCILFTPWSYWW